MNRHQRIIAALEAALQPQQLDVVDESAQHAGHAGARAEGETHYHARIVAAVFAGKSRVQRHRLVNETLAAEFASGLHAMSLQLLSPDEAE